MRILLPPSEGKTAPADAEPVRLDRLVAPELEPHRAAVIEALERLCRDEDDAASVLKLGASLRGELERNRRLRRAPTAPAHAVYTGVLYEALGLGQLPFDARRKVLVFSGLWGVVGADDAVPAYRCPAGARLPGLAPDGGALGLAAFWRPRLGEVLPRLSGREFLLDLRSGAYRQLWPAPSGAVSVRVLHEKTADGRTVRSVVSHFNKAVKGRLAGDLLAAESTPGNAGELAEALRELKHRVEVDPERPDQLDVIVADVGAQPRTV